MPSNVVRRLRPYLFNGFRRTQSMRSLSSAPALHKDDTRSVTRDYEQRVAELEARQPLSQCYPRLKENFADNYMSLAKFRRNFGSIEVAETLHSEGSTPVTVAGRIDSIRTAGNKLAFMDIYDGMGHVQVVCQYNKLHETGVELEQLKCFSKVARKGDCYTATGWPHKTSRGELSLLATELPTLVAPSLHQIPEVLDDRTTRANHRHVDMLVNDDEAVMPLLVRSEIERHFNNNFHMRGFVKVTTPLLTSGAGGAIARPFETTATELQGQPLNLRIAPELWLKRLVVGGMPRVYEIGPAFRNEGVDATHNPEFTICEYYEAFATLEDLMHQTEVLFSSLQSTIDSSKCGPQDGYPAGILHGLPAMNIDLFPPYERREFIPTLEYHLGRSLPDLSTANAQQEITEIFHEKNIPLPTRPTLPGLLDALADHYFEPLSHLPTFITHHPACLSPLSKHFRCPQTHQIVAARAELFIQGREYANMYEEENSPFEQRRKFQDQLQYRQVDGESDGKGEVDESYVQALEWGLPPTGGWGCGIDRLVMLFSGRQRIADVLPFGTLRNVVALGKGTV